MGWFDFLKPDSKDTGSGWGNVFASLAPALVSGALSYLNNDIAQDNKQADLAYAAQQDKDKMLLELKLAEIKARYGSGGGGGGGVDPNRLTAANRLAAVAGQGDAQQRAIESLIAGLQGSYNLAGRG